METTNRVTEDAIIKQPSRQSANFRGPQLRLLNPFTTCRENDPFFGTRQGVPKNVWMRFLKLAAGCWRNQTPFEAHQTNVF